MLKRFCGLCLIVYEKKTREKPVKSPRLRVFVSQVVALLVSAVLFVACAGPTPTTLPTPTTVVILTTPPAPTLASTPTPLLPTSQTPILSASPTPRVAASSSVPRLEVLAENLPGPDDLVLGPDGLVYISDVTDGTVKRLEAEGRVATIIGKLAVPEGMVFLPDGSMVVVEQGKNRLLRYDFDTQQLTTFLQMPNRTGQEGVDSIVFDAKTQTIIVPDSPNNTLLRVSADGKQVQTLARGLVRPTGAAVEPDGSILGVDENGGDVRRVPANGGPAQVIARMPVPDDVVMDAAGNIYVNTLNEGAIHRIDARTGKDQIFWRGLSDPQGIILDADGNLIIAEQGNHRLVKLQLR